jgi:Anti-sigma-K factor rskA, C-terminal
MSHTELHDSLLPLAALEALDGEDRAAFEAHRAEGCEICERELAAYRRAATLLAAALPEPEASDTARQRLLRTVRAEARAGGRGTGAWWMALAASVLLLIAVGDDIVQRRTLRQTRGASQRLAEQISEMRQELARKDLRARFLQDMDVQMILMKPMGPQPGAHGKVVYSPKARRAILLAAGLEPLPAERQYELWCISDGKAIAAGTFDMRPGPATVVESEPLPAGVMRVDKFAVTIEPKGGMPQPTGPMIIAGGA